MLQKPSRVLLRLLRGFDFRLTYVDYGLYGLLSYCAKACESKIEEANGTPVWKAKEEGGTPDIEATGKTLALMQTVVMSFGRNQSLGKPDLPIRHIHVYFPVQFVHKLVARMKTDLLFTENFPEDGKEYKHNSESETNSPYIVVGTYECPCPSSVLFFFPIPLTRHRTAQQLLGFLPLLLVPETACGRRVGDVGAAGGPTPLHGAKGHDFGDIHLQSLHGSALECLTLRDEGPRLENMVVPWRLRAEFGSPSRGPTSPAQYRVQTPTSHKSGLTFLGGSRLHRLGAIVRGHRSHRLPSVHGATKTSNTSAAESRQLQQMSLVRELSFLQLNLCSQSHL